MAGSEKCEQRNRASFKKSSYSQGHDECVEAAVLSGETWVRDTKDASGAAVWCDAKSWLAFMKAVKDDEYDVG